VPSRRIGEILVAEGLLGEAEVNRALGFQRDSGERLKLGTILLDWDFVAEDGLLRALARHHGVPAAPWSLLSLAPVEATRVIPTSMAVRFGALPYAMTRTSVSVAFLDPSNLAAHDEITAVTNKRAIPAVALEVRLLQAHQKFYGRHIPLEYRSIAQKLEARATRTNIPARRKGVDFRSSLSATPSAAERAFADREVARDEVPQIEVPEMPMPPPLHAVVTEKPIGVEDTPPSAGEIEASIHDARSREEIGHIALETFLAGVPRVLLLGCGKTAISGWRGRGEDLTAEGVAAIRIPVAEDNVFATVRASGVPHFGPLERIEWPRALGKTIGATALDCAVFPIRILGATAAFLYADRLGEPMHNEDFAVIARAAAATANALARFLLRRNNPAPPS
jgi:hypothetical protein